MTRTDESYALLKGRILDGTYGPGHRIVIDELWRETRISPIPWRESMRRLEAEGWIEIVPHVGARVVTFTEGEWVRSMNLLARLEGLATALAAPVITAEELAEARRINKDMVAAHADFDPLRFLQLNNRFHTVICHSAPDAHLNALLDTERARIDLIRRATFTHPAGRAVESVREHDVLLDLLEQHAGADQIETFARQHKLNTLEAVTRHEASSNASSVA